jgi:hypothetical protein
MSRVRRVRWNTVVTVYVLDDLEEDRRSQWITAAADRARFRHRIESASTVLEPVLIRQYRRYLDWVADSVCLALDRVLKGELSI